MFRLFIIMGVLVSLVLLGILALDGVVIGRATCFDFIELSVDDPVDEKTGIELLSIPEDGHIRISYGRNGRIGDLRVVKSDLDTRRIRLLYASKASGDAVLERIYCRTRLMRRDGTRIRCLEERSPGRILTRKGSMLVYVPMAAPSNRYFGFDLVSLNTNGVTVRFPGQGNTVSAEDGEFFEIGDTISGVDRFQLLYSSTNDRTALFRLWTASNSLAESGGQDKSRGTGAER